MKSCNFASFINWVFNWIFIFVPWKWNWSKVAIFSTFLKMGESGYSPLDLKTSSQLLPPSRKYCPVNGNIKLLEDNEFFQSLEWSLNFLWFCGQDNLFWDRGSMITSLFALLPSRSCVCFHLFMTFGSH